MRFGFLLMGAEKLTSSVSSLRVEVVEEEADQLEEVVVGASIQLEEEAVVEVIMPVFVGSTY